MAPDELSTPGKRLRFLRRSKGLTQETLGRKVHVTQAAVAQWERDARRPHPATQLLLADALDTNRSFLFGEAA